MLAARRHDTSLVTAEEEPRSPKLFTMLISPRLLISNNVGKHFMCNILGIFPKDWWAVKQFLPLSLCWHVRSPQQSVNLTLRIHQQQGLLSKVSLSFWASNWMYKKKKKNILQMRKKQSHHLLKKKKSLPCQPKSPLFNLLFSLRFIYIPPFINGAHLIG